MSRLTPRRQWSQALASAPFTASQRPVKATLLTLAAVMTPTGELYLGRDALVAATGLPVRTLTRHLQRAIEDGWLARDVPGGNGRRAQYRAIIPESCRPSVAHNSGSCGPSTRTQLLEVVGQPVAHSIREGASDSERVALNGQRGRRRTPLGGGVNATQFLRKSSSNEKASGLPAPLRRLLSVSTASAGEVA